jgi:hypothetical protein
MLLMVSINAREMLRERALPILPQRGHGTLFFELEHGTHPGESGSGREVIHRVEW